MIEAPDPQVERETRRLVVGFLRLLRHWTQTDLAEACGMDRKTIGRYESGEIAPSREIVERLAAAAGVTSTRLKQLIDLFGRIVDGPGTRGGLEALSTQDELAAEIAAEVAAEIEPEILAALIQTSGASTSRSSR